VPSHQSCKDRGMSLPVSVQICTLNEAHNIVACLEAVFLNEPEEVLVIDGGSTDGTAEIASRMGAKVLSPGRLGLGPSRKLGYMAATANYVAFVDADDRIPSDWLAQMIAELSDGGYSALQSSLRAANMGTWWGRGWDNYFKESVKPTSDTDMVGRPAIFVTADLQADDSDFESLDEDTHMSRAFEKRGLRQGVGHAVARRYVEETWSENSRKWRSYGKGYREFTRRNPERRLRMLRHMLMVIPIQRSIPAARQGHFAQPVFGLVMGSQIVLGWLKG